jgi:uncharacterized repeat protein (TIGR01451 family)
VDGFHQTTKKTWDVRQGKPPDLSISKSHTGDFTAGLSGNYTIVVSNSASAGPTTGAITVVDTLPSGMTWAFGPIPNWNCSANGQQVTCTNPGPLQPGGSSGLNLNVVVAPTAAGGTVTNQVTVSTPGETNTSNNSVTDPTVIHAAPNLSITKSHNGNFTVGGSGTYTISVTNSPSAGPTTGDITVTDTLPAGLSWAIGPVLNWNCSAVGQTVTCTNPGPLAPGGTISLQLGVIVSSTAASGTVINTASVSTPGGSNGGGSSADDPTTINPGAAPDLSITKSHTGNFVAGTTGNYTIEVTNAAGAADTTGPITVTDTLPAGLSFLIDNGPGWVCLPSQQVVTCTNLGPINAGETSTLNLDVSVSQSASGSVTNSVTVATPGETNTANNSASDQTLIQGGPEPDLSITKSHVGHFTVGVNDSYTIQVSNAASAGPTTGAITITDTLPAGLSFVSATGLNWSCSVVLQIVTCTNTFGLTPGALSGVILTVAVSSTAPATVTNYASVFTPGETAVGNNSASDQTDIQGTTPISPDLSITKSHIGNFTAGTTASYTLQVSNAASAGPTTGPVTVTDTLPAGVSFDSFLGPDWNCSASQLVVNCSRHGVLNPGEASSFVLNVAISTTTGGSVTNTATVSTPDESNTADNLANDSTTIVAAPSNSRLVFVQQPPATAYAGTAFAISPQVAVVDTQGNVDQSDNSTVVTLDVPSAVGYFVCTGGSTATANGFAQVVIHGVATFTDCSIDQVGQFHLTASAPNLPSVVSLPISLEAELRIRALLEAPSLFQSVANDAVLRIDVLRAGVPFIGDTVIRRGAGLVRSLGVTDLNGTIYTTLDIDNSPIIGAHTETFEATPFVPGGTPATMNFDYTVEQFGCSQTVTISDIHVAAVILQAMSFMASPDTSPATRYLDAVSSIASLLNIGMGVLGVDPATPRVGDVVTFRSLKYTINAGGGLQEVYREYASVNRSGLTRTYSAFTTDSAQLQAITGCPADLSALWATMASPATMLVTDPLGRRAGTDPISGNVLNEIPGALVSPMGSEPKVLAVLRPIGGRYIFSAIGTGSGVVHFTTGGFDQNGKVTEYTIDLPVVPGQVLTHSLDYPQMTVLDQSPPTRTPTPSATSTETPTATSTETSTPTATATLTPSSIPTVTSTSTATSSPTATSTLTPPPTGTSTVATVLPDLVIGQVVIELQSGSSCTLAGQPLGIRLQVSNTGSASAGSFVVNVNGATQNVAGLNVGQSTSLFFSGYQNGNNTIVVDALNQVAETREDNNSLTTQLPVPTPPATCTPTPTITVTPTATSTPTVTSTPTTGPVVTLTPTVTATSITPGAPLLGQFAVLSEERTWLQQDVRVLAGNVGASRNLTPFGRDDDDEDEMDEEDNDGRGRPRGPRHVMPTDRRAEVILGPRAAVAPATDVLGDTLWLQRGTLVYDIGFNERYGAGNVQGTATSPLSLPLLTLPPVQTCSPNSANATVRQGSVQTLAPGTYGALTVRPRATLVLTGGQYCLTSLDIEEQGRVIFRAPSELRIARTLDAAANVTIAPDPSVPTLRARDMVIHIAGQGQNRQHHGWEGRGLDTDARFGPRSTINAAVYAPNGRVWLESDVTAKGAFIGRRVRLGPRSVLTLDSPF